MLTSVCSNTVEPPNSGQVGTRPFVLYLEVVLYWGVLFQVLFFLQVYECGLASIMIKIVFIELNIVCKVKCVCLMKYMLHEAVLVIT